jgi:hypothetical protein
LLGIPPPGLRLIDTVEAENQELPEAADIVEKGFGVFQISKILQITNA